MNACKKYCIYHLTRDGTWRDCERGKSSRNCIAYYGAAISLNYTQNTKINR